MTIIERLERLERQNRRLRALLAVLGAVLGSALLMGQRAPASRPAAAGRDALPVIRARRFEVVNDAGQAVVTLMTWEKGGWIETRDHAGHRLFDVSATDDGAGLLSTYNREGRDTVALGGVKDGSGLLVVFDGKGRKLIAAGAAADGEGVIAAYGRGDRVRAFWP